MGFLQFRFATKWADSSIFKTYFKKFKKYDQMNKKDLKDIKVRALELRNFEQYEKTIEYEDFLKNSYFSQFLVSMWNSHFGMLESLQNKQKDVA